MPALLGAPTAAEQERCGRAGESVMRRFELLWSRGGRLLLAPLVALLLLQGVRAQTRFVYSSGQSVSPAYEGWWQTEDGSFEMFFGYMNSNWLQELDIPIGPDNNI